MRLRLGASPSAPALEPYVSTSSSSSAPSSSSSSPLSPSLRVGGAPHTPPSDCACCLKTGGAAGCIRLACTSPAAATCSAKACAVGVAALPQPSATLLPRVGTLDVMLPDPEPGRTATTTAPVATPVYSGALLALYRRDTPCFAAAASGASAASKSCIKLSSSAPCLAAPTPTAAPACCCCWPCTGVAFCALAPATGWAMGASKPARISLTAFLASTTSDIAAAGPLVAEVGLFGETKEVAW